MRAARAACSVVKVSTWRLVAPIAQLVKGRLSDAGGLRSESQAERVTGKSIPSFWEEKHPVIQGLRSPEHHAGHLIRIKKIPPSQATTNSTWRRGAIPGPLGFELQIKQAW